MSETNENAEKTWKTRLLNNWQLIIILLFLVLTLFLWEQNKSKQLQLDRQAAVIQVAEDIKKIDSKLAEMKKREEELYPIIAKQIAKLESVELSIEKARKELANERKKQLESKLDKMDLSDLSDTLNTMGYPNHITSCE